MHMNNNVIKGTKSHFEKKNEKHQLMRSNAWFSIHKQQLTRAIIMPFGAQIWLSPTIAITVCKVWAFTEEKNLDDIEL